MGCTASTHTIAEDENDPFLQIRKANDAIEHSLQLEKQREKNEMKLLLLGAGESGKSTVLKQLKLLHQGGFSHQERLQYSQVIWADAIQSMKILIIQARKLGIKLDCDNPTTHNELFQAKSIVLKTQTLQMVDANVAGGSDFLNDYVLKYSERHEAKRRVQSTGQAKAFDPENEKQTLQENSKDMDSLPETDEKMANLKDISKDLNETGNDQMFIEKKHDNARKDSRKQYSNIEIAHSIKALWENDKGIRQCFHRSNEFQLEGSASYYFDNILKFADQNYVCTDEDILKGRIKTTGITENDFNIGSTKFKVLDAGGQRSERKKWIHSFQGITAVIFVLATSEYDQMLFEDERVNRMHESIMLFETLVNSKWFSNTPFILFLNKIDLFEEKVKKTPIRKYFPDYQGRIGDAEAGLSYFEKIFLSLNRNNKPIYVRRTCATDTQTMKFVLSAVTDLIIQQNLKKSGII
ncbi:guanine nucleotide-binding protein subunit alpha KNAG_0M02500 [Huiozyma naganishii CBS 8797]|uniref:Guanine nucleotide-binding protein alpha-1 subunit n=1 Tax=Huiozyma naganishii (strain ATCC MYA-139 / BCRC 22969 / CBS 8797 / KCTC 17520 / NBRC 10181 / NCYC 3082 / Yp74L-3) TaxID=1071383 RepID=J7RT28_HUIN7|nr:hypothetical protein KNAG_0M02500 [Kazachstania naganishii CBS 8797]CCK73103.1 hypothetical protein KNAG_0M02500 [Kazachstania naganishii CBS 8797]